jgi:hypothetical protein
LIVGIPLVFNAVLVFGLMEIIRLRREIHDVRWEMKDLYARLKHIEEMARTPHPDTSRPRLSRSRYRCFECLF